MVNFETFIHQKKTEEALRAQNDLLFEEVIKLRKQLEERKAESNYIYIVKDGQNNVVGYYKNRSDAMDVIQFKQKAIEHIIESELWVITPKEEESRIIKEESFHLEVKKFES